MKEITSLFNDSSLERCVAGAVKNTIDAHGPITKQYISSLTKRIVNQFRASLIDYTKQNSDESIKEECYKQRISRLEAERDNLLKKVRDFNAQNKATYEQKIAKSSA